MLDARGSLTAFPQADEPQAGEPIAGQTVEFFIGDLIEGVDGTLVGFGELVEPHVGVFGQEHQAGHPFAVGAEALGLQFGGRAVVEGDGDGAGAETGERQLFFFFHQVEAGKQAVEIAPQKLTPAGADELQLAGEGMGHGHGGGAQHVDQILLVGAEGGLGVKEGVQLLQDGQVGAFALQVLVVEQLFVLAHGGILVGHPQHEHLFEGQDCIGLAFAFALQVLFGVDFAAVHRHRGKFLVELQQGLVHRLRAETCVEMFEGLAHHGGVDLAAVEGHDVVQDFVNQAHRVDLPGAHGAFREVDQVAALVHFLREQAGGVKIGKENAAS